MATSSRINELINHFVTTLDAALDEPVYDGARPTADYLPAWIEVGADSPDTPDALINGGTSKHTWRGLGAKNRDEDIIIPIVAWSWSGDDSLSVERARAFTLAEAAEDAVTSDPCLGGIALFGGVGEFDYSYAFTEDGVRVAVVFTVMAKARLTTA